MWTSEEININGFFDSMRQLNGPTAQGSGIPSEEIALLKSSGLLGIVLPNMPYDFRDGHMPSILHLLKRFGRAHGAMGRIYEGHINALFLIHQYGMARQKEHWYRLVLEDQAVFGVWNTDAQDGLRYVRTAEGIVLQGSKAFCSGADLVDHALMGGKWEIDGQDTWQMAILPMYMVEEGRIDRESWNTLGMRASISYTIDFSKLKMEEQSLLGRPEDYTKRPFFLGGAIRFAAVHTGMAEAILQATLSYLIKMGRTDDVFQKARLAHMEMALRTGDLWLREAAAWFDKATVDADQYGEALEMHAHMTRLAVERIGLYVIEQSAICVGARGLMAEEGIENLHRDLLFYLRQPAPDATLQQVGTFVVDKGTKIVDIFDGPLEGATARVF
ncbi:acyl-CoA dehydrogenase family protein [Olivibacter sitiensis]|uniref:acyl-CoA dehydrogenase family protein n=1 Tax=Olivibacter sitiensis TaxID=376470 RepID=UPI0003FC1730|nr:acyl-CoA dehydrogenase family protein [Olivibacter sitiensis]